MRPKCSSPLLQTPPLFPILSHINSSQPIYLRLILLYFHLRLGLPCSLFPSSFPNKILYELLVSCSVSTRGTSPIKSRGHEHLLPRLSLCPAEGQICVFMFVCLYVYLSVCLYVKRILYGKTYC